MAKRVINAFELVEIQKQQRHHILVAPRVLEALIEAVLEEAAVLQSGQRVIEGQLFHLCVGLTLLADVLDTEDDVTKLSRLVQNW